MIKIKLIDLSNNSLSSRHLDQSGFTMLQNMNIREAISVT